MIALTMTEWVIVSPSLLKWDPLVYDPNFDLGIGKEWLPKYPVTVVSYTSSATVSHVDQSEDQTLTDDDEVEFWQSFGAIDETMWNELTTDKIKDKMSP